MPLDQCICCSHLTQYSHVSSPLPMCYHQVCTHSFLGDGLLTTSPHALQSSLRLDVISEIMEDHVEKDHLMDYKRHEVPPLTCQIMLCYHLFSLGMYPPHPLTLIEN